jgi:competence protein ComEA
MKIGREMAVGSVALLGLTAFTVLIQSSGIFPTESSPPEIRYASCVAGTVAVELAGDSGRNGIYCVPRGTPVAAFLDLAGIRREAAGKTLPGPSILDRPATVSVSKTSDRVETRPMDAAKRFALGIPIDVNRSSREELVLVPGIGEATAERILDRRSRAGSFRTPDDLLQVKGIGEKRLEKLRPYLCVGC